MCFKSVLEERGRFDANAIHETHTSRETIAYYGRFGHLKCIDKGLQQISVNTTDARVR